MELAQMQRRKSLSLQQQLNRVDKRVPTGLKKVNKIHFKYTI